MFIQTRNREIEKSQGSMKPSFEDFCKGLINEQERLIVSGQLTPNKALMAHNIKNHNKVFHKNPKSHTKRPSQHSSNDVCVDVSKKKVFNPCMYCGKTNHPENI
jgi:hypothetical protein